MADQRRIAFTIASYAAVPPPGTDPVVFAAAALADTYEVLAGLEGVTSGIAGSEAHRELLWPDSVLRPDSGVRRLADGVSGDFDALVLVPADVPDLPPLVVAKVFKALVRADLCLAPARNGGGLAAIGLQLPWPDWLPDDLDLDEDPYPELARRVPDRRLLTRAPDWHRLRSPADTNRLDPGLEGWEETRAVLSGRPLSGQSLP